ncbi:hypothetical protein TNCV_269371 [Trichonephila clavipes]|nr:hypothetical protein TNCV_269371 [Trichonephila clavipes]
MLLWHVRSPDLSPIEHVRNINGRQLHYHPQPALTVPLLTQQVQQVWNFILQRDIQYLSELSLWRKNHSEMLIFDPYSVNPVWNSFGIIDTLRTAVELIYCKGLHFEQRFTLACYYWLTKEMLDMGKSVFSGKGNPNPKR